jgi:ornithine cyclodeaminase/alanine dehydrogenase-like protein (mu-crystallin family)
MTGPTLRLDADEVLRALERIDLLGAMVEDLVGRASGGAARPGPGPVPEPETRLVPAATLRVIRIAALAGLAARELHAPGVVTAAIVGADPAAQLYLSVIARALPNLSHVAVCATSAEPAHPIAPSVLAQLDRAGIGLSITADLRQAAFGANLLVIARHGRDRLDLGPLSPGALLINAAGRDLPDELLDGVDQLYVDDLGLLEEHKHRNFVRLHLDGPEPVLQQREGLHRHQAVWRHHRRIEADLWRLLTGAHPGRSHVDDVLLVELLSENTVDAALACRLHQTAVELGLGHPDTKEKE